MKPAVPQGTESGSGVQSLDRAVLLLELLADAGGSMRLAELEAATGLPLPTVHRLLRALSHNGYVRQEPSRRYALGPRLIRVGEIAGRGLGSVGMPHLTGLVAEVEETANMALLDGDEVLYIAHVPSRHSMRMFTEVGRRVRAHCTAVGKALLSQLSTDEVLALLSRTGMPATTSETITDPQALLAQLDQTRERGWAVDHSEQEVGVWCVAAPIIAAPARVAISISGPAGRLTPERVSSIAPILTQAAQTLSRELQGETAAP